MAGIRTYELEQSQAALKAAQREVGDQAREVLEMAERNKEVCLCVCAMDLFCSHFRWICYSIFS